MTLSVPTWALSLLLTVAVWALGFLLPVAPSRGDYDFGPAFTGLFRLVICVIGTLVFWLVFFVAKAGGWA
jgi:hypothetical protein